MAAGDLLLAELACMQHTIRRCEQKIVEATDEGAKARLLVQWMATRERCYRVAIAALRAGIAERQVQLAEREGERLAEVLAAFTKRLSP